MWCEFNLTNRVVIFVILDPASRHTFHHFMHPALKREPRLASRHGTFIARMARASRQTLVEPSTL